MLSSRSSSRLRRRSRATGFILLEVIVAIVILGLSIATLMRSFTLSMRAIRKNDVTTTACMLADRLVQEFELKPPEGKQSEGSFEDLGYPNYKWTAKYVEEDIRYRLKTKGKVEGLRGLKLVTVNILYDDQRMRQFSPIQLDLYLPPIERFSAESKFRNELFLEEGVK